MSLFDDPWSFLPAFRHACDGDDGGDDDDADVDGGDGDDHDYLGSVAAMASEIRVSRLIECCIRCEISLSEMIGILKDSSLFI